MPNDAGLATAQRHTQNPPFWRDFNTLKGHALFTYCPVIGTHGSKPLAALTSLFGIDPINPLIPITVAISVPTPIAVAVSITITER